MRKIVAAVLGLTSLSRAYAAYVRWREQEPEVVTWALQRETFASRNESQIENENRIKTNRRVEPVSNA
jgi:hypothetical protein